MKDYSEHIWHPFGHPNQEFEGLEGMHVVSADGVYIKDVNGKEYLDSNAGGLWCVNVGHNHPEMKAAITKQLDELAFFQLFHRVSHPSATKMANKLIEMTQPEKMTRVYFTSGGSDSIDTAIKLSRQFHLLNGEPERRKIISVKGCYHGAHTSCMSLGNPLNRRVYGPFMPDEIHVEPPLLYRNPWNCEDPEELVDLCIDNLVSEIEYQVPSTIAALVAEPIIANLLMVPPASYWPRLREVCDKYGILLISDEVVTGFGRSGELFGCRAWNTAPDMMCCAKGISSGYVPLGAVLVNERVSTLWEENNTADGLIFPGFTYAGHPLACAAGVAAMDILENEHLVENSKIQGDYLLGRLKPFIEKFKSVGDVRGKGLMICLDLVADKKTREPIDSGVNFSKGLPTHVANIARREGVYVRPLANRIILSPSLVFTQKHCDQLVNVLDKAFSEADR